MHINPHSAPFPELDALRGQLGISQSRICQLAELNPSTYTRWRKWARGIGGHCPMPRSLWPVREALAKELQRKAAPVTAD